MINKKQDTNIKKTKNIYKTLFLTTIFIIIILLLVFSFNYYSNKKFKQGMQFTIYSIFEILEKEGKVSINLENKTATLVSEVMLSSIVDELVNQIIETVETQGYVSIYNNETQLMLVPYQQE